MRSPDQFKVGDEVIEQLPGAEEPCLKQIVTSLFHHLNEFEREVELTPEEAS